MLIIILCCIRGGYLRVDAPGSGHAATDTEHSSHHQAIKAHKRKLQESIRKVKPEMAGMPEMMKGKPQKGFNLKPKKVRDPKARADGVKKKPVMHPRGFGQHAKKVRISTEMHPL